jgi:DNA end-binding protein Ku
MAARSSWKGYLRLSLVSIPVQAFNAAASDGGEFHFHQLHATCHSRIRYQKVCPVHGEVSNDEIVRGYEYAKGKYVIIDDDEIDKLRTANDRAINIDTFVSPDAIDPAYFDGRTYYLQPDGPIGQKPYAVLLEALAHQKRWAVGQGVFFGREQLLLVRPVEQVLCVEMLHYAAQVRSLESISADTSLPGVTKEELRLANKLIESSTRDKFDLAEYQDQYTLRVKELIEAKVAGKEIVAPPSDEEPPVINLMDALRKSVAQAKGRPKKPAAGARRTAGAKRRRGGRKTA